jgi:uncharacterized membrane protein YtjA (UPF0391 family)
MPDVCRGRKWRAVRFAPAGKRNAPRHTHHVPRDGSFTVVCRGGAQWNVETADGVSHGAGSMVLPAKKREELVMLKWAIISAVIAIIAGALGFTVVAGAAATIAKVLFFTFLVLFVILLIAVFAAGKKVSSAFRRDSND